MWSGDPVKKKPKSKKQADPWADAVEHLRKVDAKWAARIEKVGPCRLPQMPDRFATLVRSIISQQISTKAAAAIEKRLRENAGDPHEPNRLIAFGHEKLRTVGLSATKAQYVLNLADAVNTGEAPLHAYDDWTDEEIIKNLTKIKGIGAWTAEMFLVFSLNRPDVLSPGDLGIRAAIKRHHDLPEIPTPKQCRELTENLRPFRSVAMWYFWEEVDKPG